MGMIKVNGQIGFTLDFEQELEISEESWMALSDREQIEMITEHLDRQDYNNLEPDGIDIWDLENIEKVDD